MGSSYPVPSEAVWKISDLFDDGIEGPLDRILGYRARQQRTKGRRRGEARAALAAGLSVLGARGPPTAA